MKSNYNEPYTVVCYHHHLLFNSDDYFQAHFAAHWRHVVAIALATYFINKYFIDAFQFDFGFMDIFANALLTILFLIVIKKKDKWQLKNNLISPKQRMQKK